MQAVKTCEDPSLVNRFSVKFDDCNSKAEFLETDLVGPGFKPVTSIKLEAGQLVYVTHMQREMAGRVVRHDFDSQDVIITLNDVSTYRVGGHTANVLYVVFTVICLPTKFTNKTK